METWADEVRMEGRCDLTYEHMKSHDEGGSDIA